MPVNETKNSLRSALQNKSTEELEQLLAADFSEEEDAVPNVEYITTILEVIHEREDDTPEQNAEVEAAWHEFQAFLREEEQTQREQNQTGRNESPSLDHLCNSDQGQTPCTRSRTQSHTKPRAKSYTRALRICAVAAALIVLFCGSAYAAGWNIFQALAEWTEETFGFLIGSKQEEEYEYGQSVYEFMRLAVEKHSDTPAVPNWIPEGMEQVGEIVVGESSRKTNVMGTFGDGTREFTVKVSIYNTLPEDYAMTYQKDNETVQVYRASNVDHYIVWNYDNAGVMWTNGNVEGHIQGVLTEEELQRMIDSIYEE